MATPSKSLGLKGTPPASKNMTAPIGYESDRLAIRERM